MSRPDAPIDAPPDIQALPPAAAATVGHGRAAALMVLITLLWSIAGVVSRQLEAARSFEVTFWRSAFTALALWPALALLHRGTLWRDLRGGGRWLWVSALCWCVMFTGFMLAITMTTVATVLVTLSATPLLTALFARVFLGERLGPATWGAIAVAAFGIAWMFGPQAVAGGGAWQGALVASGVPVAAAVNWTVLQHLGERGRRESGFSPPPMLLAVGLGALLSALITLWPAWPFVSTAADLGWLALLGVAQLAVPCLLVVMVARVLPAPEVALLGLLEVLFGVLWAWWGAGEVPQASTLQGGALVLGAMLVHGGLNLRAQRRLARSGARRT